MAIEKRFMIDSASGIAWGYDSSTGDAVLLHGDTVMARVTRAGAVTTTAGMTATGAAILSNTLAVTGAATLSSTLAVTGAVTLSSTLAVTGNITSTGGINGAPIAELQAVDPSQKCTWFSDFLGDALPDEVAGTAGGGTGNAVALQTAGLRGILDITSASDDGVITANASAIELGGLNYTADMGGLVMEAKLAIDDVSEAMLFFGFTDVLPSGTLEAPVFLNGADIDSDASDACGIFLDKDGTTGDEFGHGGVKANTDTVPAFTGTTVIDNAEHVLRVEVSSTGAVQGFVDGTAIGAAVANAVTATTKLCPVIVVANRSANAVVVSVDYMWVQVDR